MAAHLHDSVLQTLALIQKNSGDPATVARLARAQERDLRAWLYAGESTDDAPSPARCAGRPPRSRTPTASRRRRHRRRLRLDEALRPVVAATREAVTNAAKHAGAAGRRLRRDHRPTRSTCSCATAVAASTRPPPPTTGYGVRHSIIDRMQRHGGTGEIRSTVGEGTEVRLHLPRPQTRRGHDE